MILLAISALVLPAAAFAEAAFDAAGFTRPVIRSSVGFDPQAQAISTSGEHAFVPPGPGDLRGPCPGINALANHGYLPHNGVGTTEQYISAISSVYGMGIDLATFLGVYGSVVSGDLLSFSLGGPQPMSSVNPLAGLLGQPQGLSNSHDKFEGDASPTRGDLYTSKNDYELVLENFKSLYAYQAHKSDDEANYDIDVLTAHRAARFENSVAENPYFFWGPFTGTLANPAAYTFIFRLMGNKSAEYPEGRMSQEGLKSFFAISGDSPDDFVYTPGHERIPDNWYRRAFGDEYGFVPYFQDAIAAGIKHPELFDVGGNTGAVNTFTPIDIDNLTGGLYNAANLADGDNFACYTLQLLQQAIPDLLKGALQDLTTALDMLDTEIAQALDGFSCPQLSSGTYSKFEQSFQQYPGFTKLGKNGQY